MSSQDYKKIALEYFRKGDLKNAKLYLSLAYEKRPNKALLNLIELCEFANNSPEEGFLLFEFYMQNCKVKSINEEFEKLLNLRENQSLDKSLEDGALSYIDFLESEKKVGFKKSFENVIFATKLIISNEDDFLDFLEKLLDNGYKETTLNYIESVAKHFAGNAKFLRLQEKLKAL